MLSGSLECINAFLFASYFFPLKLSFWRIHFAEQAYPKDASFLGFAPVGLY